MPEEQVNSQADEELLRECREDFTYCKSYWQENYDEARKDMDAVLCIPPDDFRNDRAGRPCLWPDELSQYVNQTNNNLRQTKRAIKVSPRGEEAKDEDAEHRQAYIQGIEYTSKAQSIYSNAFESCVECGFGFWRLNLLVTGPKGEQEPRIRRIPNWSTVLPDPDAKEADFSDSMVYFVTDTMRQTTFARRYPKAKKRSFTGADTERAPGWLNGENITVAEWWTREHVSKKEKEGAEAKPEKSDGDGDRKEDADEDGPHFKVTQRIVNGLEILETNEWIGSWIPIIGCFGLEKYKSEGNSSKRLFLSLIRRARGAQQMLAYIASQEAEEFGMAPRAPLQGYKGQFIPDQHKNLNKVPQAYVEYQIPQNWEPQWGPPPLPSRQPFVPNAQAYEIAFERWRRSIQAAVGVMPLPTTAQNQNEKSGIALQKIQSQESIGSYHFTDNFVRALTNTGLQLNELITELAKLDSLPQTVVGKDQKGEDVRLQVAGRDQKEEAADSQHLPEADLFFAHRGEFDVAISDGPSELSQREEVSAFVDTLLQTLPSLGMPPQLVQEIVAIAIRLKNIGTYGDEIADMLAPPQEQDIPPQAKALVVKAQAQLQQAMAEVQQLRMEKLGKVTETQGKLAIEQTRQQTVMSEADKDRETKVLVAEITTKAQSLSERMSAFEDMMKQFHSQAHELAMQIQQQGAQMQLAKQNALAASQQSAQEAAQSQAQPQNGAQ